MFQMMFAAISPLLITGAYAGRLSLRASLCLTTLWEVLVYYPVAHWIWGGGWLSRMGAQDFAGGIVIHTTAGTASVVCALVLGQRAGFDKAGGHFPPSSLPMVMVGGALLCTGWFGFTAGCVLNVDVGSRTAIAIVNTQLAAAISACVWALLVWRQRTPNLTDVLNGAIAGLAGITPCAGYVYPWKALIVGLLSGVLSYEFVEVARFRWGLDDALDVSAVHGVTGVVGSIAIGILANREIGGHSTGLVYDFGFKDPAIVSSLRFLGVQCLAVVVAGAYSALVTYAILRFLKAIKSLSDLQDSDDDDDDAADLHHATGHVQVSAMARPTERTPLL
jgi:Amt family ammonium transporter